MSDDVRNEAADIARALRRRIERERALGTGELLAAGVAKARREGVAEVAPPPVATRTAVPTIEPEAVAGDDVFSLTPPPAIEPPAAKRAARKTVVEPEPGEIDLPSFTDDLYPSALDGGRDQLVVLAEPVLKAVADEARACKKCGLCTTRTNAVPGVGSARTGIVFVGEAPGADEDARGEPFVGRAGELLTKMIAAMDEKKLVPGVKLSRETVYIANVLKCRPPENRNPLPHEIEACSPYLMRQLEALQPRVICCLGKFAAELLLQLKGTISSMRGKTYRWRGAKLIVTYHPAYCLRSPSAKRPVWDDLQRLAQEYLTD
jgi:DNA polymerase